MKMFSAILSILSANFLYFILHINNTSSFPKPLNSKDEANALERLKNGDKDARALLIERNLRLVSHIVKKYYSKTNDTDDLISIGTIGLIKAIDSFNPDKGIRLATYASRCIEKATLSVRLFLEQKTENTLPFQMVGGYFIKFQRISTFYQIQKTLHLSNTQLFMFSISVLFIHIAILRLICFSINILIQAKFQLWQNDYNISDIKNLFFKKMLLR